MTYTCAYCGKEEDPSQYFGGEERRNNARCFSCDHFLRILDRDINERLIVHRRIGGRLLRDAYSTRVTDSTKQGHRNNGFGGDLIVFKTICGQVISSNSVGHLGEIPEVLYNHFPVNACIVSWNARAFSEDVPAL